MLYIYIVIHVIISQYPPISDGGLLDHFLSVKPSMLFFAGMNHLRY